MYKQPTRVHGHPCTGYMLPYSVAPFLLRALTRTCVSNSLFHMNSMPHTHSWKCRGIHTKDLRNRIWWIKTKTESYVVGATLFITSSIGQNPVSQPDTRCPASLLAHTKHINQSIQSWDYNMPALAAPETRRPGVPLNHSGLPEPCKRKHKVLVFFATRRV